MTKLLETYKTFDIVVVPFPFVDSDSTKNRPALVVSSATFNAEGHTVLLMITSAQHSKWPLDISITDLKNTGLIKSSIVRQKFFTLDNRLIKKKIGHLSENDKAAFYTHFHALFEDIFEV